MGKNVQIPIEVFDGMWWLLDNLKKYPLDQADKETCAWLQREIGKKLEAMQKRELFSEYKKAEAGSAEREVKRRAYLDKAEIHKDWRSPNEIPSSQI